ncbi:MAG: HK97 gp10 family phage protein [Christensenellales bacterium]|nr:MAG TPA: putative tail component [Caudoviricetes sp.]
MADTIRLEDYQAELDKILTDFLHANFDARQKAVQAGAEVLRGKLEQASPRDTGEFAKSWKIKEQYPNVRYVGNTKTAKGTVNERGADGKIKRKRENVPLSNVLEYKEGGKPFIRATADAAESEIFAAIKRTIENGG